MPLMTTRFPNQYDAPGGLKPRQGDYHAWQSCDMKNWVHHGPVTERFSKQVARTPAQLDLMDFPAGHAFQIELKLIDITENKSKPTIESLSLSLK